MAYQFIISSVILSLSFAFASIGNVLLAVVIVKLKRQEERESFDRRRHFDVLFTSLAVGDALGSCLNYPMLLLSYKLSFEGKISRHFCEIVGSSAAFYFSYISTLTVTMNLHHIIGHCWPFRYFIYLRRKNSKIPFLCVGVSVCVALVSLALSASGFTIFKLNPDSYFGIRTCVPDVDSYDSFANSKYYYLIVGHFCFWMHFFTLIPTTFQYVRMRSNRLGQFSSHRVGGNSLPDGAWFQIAFKMLYIVFWTPFIVAMTIVTCSSYQLPTEVLVTVCYLMFVPGVIGPFVHYVTHGDLKDVFNTTIRNLISRNNGHHEKRVPVEEIELQN